MLGRFSPENFLNGANFLLLTLILLSLLLCWWKFDTYSKIDLETNKIAEFRVLEESTRPDPFHRLFYYVWLEGGIWQLESPKKLVVGQEYLAVVRLIYFDFSPGTNKFDQSKLALGLLGKLKVIQFLAKNTNCDLVCQFLQAIKSIRNYTSEVYYQASCRDYLVLVDIFAVRTNCQDVFALSYGLVLGGTEKFSQSVYTQIRTLGLTHLVAVSGFQVVLVVSILEFLSLKIKLARKTRLLLSVLGVVLLIVLAGPQPPVLRSSVSVLLSMIVLVFLGRKLSSWRALVYSGLILLWINPLYLASPSFQLSFLASLGLILANQSNSELSHQWLQNLKDLLASCVATFVMTLPVIVGLSGKVNLLAIVTNVLVLPIIPVVSVLNVLGLVPWVGQLFLILAILLQSILLTLIQEISTWSVANWLTFSLEFSNLIWWFLYYGTILVLSYFWKKRVNSFQF